MKTSVKIDIRTATAQQKEVLAFVLARNGAYRVECGKRHALTDHASVVWATQNGYFVYVSADNQVTQGYGENKFNRCPLPQVTIADII